MELEPNPEDVTPPPTPGKGGQDQEPPQSGNAKKRARIGEGPAVPGAATQLCEDIKFVLPLMQLALKTNGGKFSSNPDNAKAAAREREKQGMKKMSQERRDELTKILSNVVHESQRVLKDAGNSIDIPNGSTSSFGGPLPATFTSH